jgi:hypothetical protein
MEPARPLRDVFADLVTDEDVRRAHAADPDGFLQAHGHTELPGQLVTEAIVNYADTAPAEVAEHLAPFVMAHSPVPVDDGGTVTDADPIDGLQLLATAPAEQYLDELADHSPDAPDGAELAGHQHGADLAAADAGTHDPFDLDFGHGDMIEGGHHVSAAAGESTGADGAHDAGHLHEAHVDDALRDLESGHVDVGHFDPGHLDGHPDPGHLDAGQLQHEHGWLDGHDPADGGHDLAGGADHLPNEDIADL